MKHAKVNSKQPLAVCTVAAILFYCNICEASTISTATTCMITDASTTREPPAAVVGFCASRSPFNGFCTWNSILPSFTNHTLQRKRVDIHDDWTLVICDESPTMDYCTSLLDLVCYIHEYDNDFDTIHKRFKYRVVSTNTFEEIKHTDLSADFNIQEDSYPCPPVNITIQAMSSSSVEVTWKPPTDYPRYECRDLQYRIRYKVHRNSKFNVTSSYKLQDSARQCTSSTSITKTVSGLYPPYTNVYIQIAAASSKSIKKGKWSEWSPMLYTRLLPAAPSQAPGSFTSETVSNDDNDQLINVLLSWQAIPEDLQNGPILGYNISIQGQPATGFTEYQHYYIADQNATEYTIQGLNKTYQYTIDILAYNTAGKSPKWPTPITIHRQPSPEDIANNFIFIIPVSASLVILIVIFSFIGHCMWKKNVASRQHFEVTFSSNVLERNYNLENASFQTQEPEHFDDVITQINSITCMAGSYINIRETVPNFGTDDTIDMEEKGCQSPGAESSGCGTLASYVNLDRPCEGTGDNITYHTMSPTGLSPIVTHFPYEHDMMVGETVRPPLLPVVSDNVLNIGDFDENTNMIEDFVSRCLMTPKPAESKVRAGIIGNTKSLDEELSNPYAKQSVLPKTPTNNSARGEDIIKDGDQQTMLKNCSENKKDMVKDKETTSTNDRFSYTKQSLIPTPVCYGKNDEEHCTMVLPLTSEINTTIDNVPRLYDAKMAVPAQDPIDTGAKETIRQPDSPGYRTTNSDVVPCQPYVDGGATSAYISVKNVLQPCAENSTSVTPLLSNSVKSREEEVPPNCCVKHNDHNGHITRQLLPNEMTSEADVGTLSQ